MTIPLGILAATKPTVSGGTLYSDSTYYYRAFTSSGTLTVANAPFTFDALIIGGGGSSGATGWWPTPGGGGAGGVRLATSVTVAPGNTSVTVGAGGVATLSSGYWIGGSGGTSSILSLQATGGDGGGSPHRTGPFSLAGGNQGSPTGYNGGSGDAGYWDGQAGSGGGGGATAAGTSAVLAGNGISYIAGSGGAGTSAYSTWASVTGTGVSGVYAKGGNGYASGGGVSPSTQHEPANTGNGASGEKSSGGSGLVIVRYPKTAVAV